MGVHRQSVVSMLAGAMVLLASRTVRIDVDRDATQVRKMMQQLMSHFLGDLGRVKSDSLLSDQEAIRLQVVAGAGFEPATFGL